MDTTYMQNVPRQSSKGLWWLTFILSAVLYLLTCQRGVSWQDSGMFQWRVLNSDLTGDLGLALAHPLYIAAGKLFVWFPLGRYAHAAEFFKRHRDGGCAGKSGCSALSSHRKTVDWIYHCSSFLHLPTLSGGWRPLLKSIR